MKYLPKWFRAHIRRDKGVIRKYVQGVKDAEEGLDKLDNPREYAGEVVRFPGMLAIETDDWWAMGFVGRLIDESGTDAIIEYRDEKEGRAMRKGFDNREMADMLKAVANGV
mgnify:CR=1 FL=1